MRRMWLGTQLAFELISRPSQASVKDWSPRVTSLVLRIRGSGPLHPVTVSILTNTALCPCSINRLLTTFLANVILKSHYVQEYCVIDSHTQLRHIDLHLPRNPQPWQTPKLPYLRLENVPLHALPSPRHSLAYPIVHFTHHACVFVHPAP